MKEYDLIINSYGNIKFFPDTLAEEILQNVYTIITTQKFSVPLDREFGISATMLDSPINTSISVLKAEIVQAVRKFEPRARITKIDFDETLDGKLFLRLKVAINE